MVWLIFFLSRLGARKEVKCGSRTLGKKIMIRSTWDLSQRICRVMCPRDFQSVFLAASQNIINRTVIIIIIRKTECWMLTVTWLASLKLHSPTLHFNQYTKFLIYFQTLRLLFIDWWSKIIEKKRINSGGIPKSQWLPMILDQLIYPTAINSIQSKFSIG